MDREEYVGCSDCGKLYPSKDDKVCPRCEYKVVCPKCTYCHECEVLVEEMEICGCGGVVDDATGLCMKCEE